jgi:hypothetical protein
MCDEIDTGRIKPFALSPQKRLPLINQQKRATAFGTEHIRVLEIYSECVNALMK